MSDTVIEETQPNALFWIKAAYSMVLLIFSIVIVMALIFSGQTKIASDVSPILAFVVLWGAILWLTMIEGGQASLVGLPPVDVRFYKDSHPKSFMSTKLTNKGDNLDRYLMGRQFMVVLVVFSINNAGNPLPGAEVLGLPEIITKIFLGSGLAMILLTCNIGQLTSQVNASHCMLDYINNYFALFTLYVAMIIESTGLLHACYFFHMIIGYLAGQPIESKEEPRDFIQNFYYWLRIAVSLAALGYAFAVTFVALLNGQTTMWASVPGWAAIILFFIFLSIVGMLEGMQIAFFAVTKLPSAERGKSKIANAVCNILFHGDGHNLPGFMVGRQLCVVSCMFFVARVTSLNVVPGTGNNVLGVSDGLQNFFNTGLLGAFITTVVGSITWQLVASVFPIAFLSSPFTYILLRICLLLEATGICTPAWVFAMIQKKIMGFQRDEVYIGTPEERAKRQWADHDEDEGGHIRIPVYPVGLDKMPKSKSERLVWLANEMNTLAAMESDNDEFTDKEKGDLDLEEEVYGNREVKKSASNDVISC